MNNPTTLYQKGHYLLELFNCLRDSQRSHFAI